MDFFKLSGELSVEDQILLQVMILSKDKIFQEIIPKQLFLYPYESNDLAPIELSFCTKLINLYSSIIKSCEIGCKDYLYPIYAQKLGYKQNPSKLYYTDINNNLIIVDENIIDRDIYTIFDGNRYYCSSLGEPVSTKMINSNCEMIKRTDLFLNERSEYF